MAVVMPTLRGGRCTKLRAGKTKVAAWESPTRSAGSGFDPLEQVFKPLAISMKIFGLYQEVSGCNAKATEVEEGDAGACPRRKWWTARFATMKTYCVLVVAFLWVNMGRFIVGFFPTDETLVLRAICAIWMFQCVMFVTCVLVGCTKRSHLRAFFQEWDSIFHDEAARNLGLKPVYCRKFSAAATSLGWLMFAVNFASLGYLQWGGTSLGGAVQKVFAKPFEPSVAVTVVVWVAQVYLTAAWAFLPMFAIFLSYVIKTNFNALTDLIDRRISEAEKKVPEQLEELRVKHLRMSDAVAVLDRNFRYANAVLYVTGIPLLCLVSYQLATVNMDALTIAVNVFWLVAGLFGVLFISIMMAKVHDSAHAPLDAIFRVQPFNASPEQLGQLTLFLTKLTGTSVGFTVMNLMVITKELILTIGGLYITYFFLLLQFRIN